MSDNMRLKELEYDNRELKKQIAELKKEIHYLKQYKEALDKTTIVSKTDPQGIIIDANEMFEKISGYKKEELVGKPHNIVRHPDMPKSVFKKMWDTIKQGKIFRGTIKNRKKDGGEYYVLANVVPIKDENGKIIEYIAIRQDLTKRVLAQQEAESLFANFIKYLKNKLKTPLYRINKYLTALADRKEAIGIKRELLSIQRVIDNVDIANELREKRTYELQAVPVGRVVKHFYTKYKPLYPNKKIHITIEANPVIKANQRLFMNVIDNMFFCALEYSGKDLYIGLDDEKFFVKADKCPFHKHSTSFLTDLKKGKEVDIALYNIHKIVKLHQLDFETTENSAILRF